MRQRLLCAIVASLCATAAAGSQVTGRLPAELRSHLADEQFAIVTSVRGLPLGVRDRLQTLFGGRALEIAEPGADFQLTGQNVNPQLPVRRLIAAGCARDYHCLVYYERGGGAHTWRALLFGWTPAETRFEWGAVAPGGLSTIEDVLKAILSGTINGETGQW